MAIEFRKNMDHALMMQKEPNRYIENHNNRGLGLVEIVIFVALGSLIAFLALAILRQHGVI